MIAGREIFFKIPIDKKSDIPVYQQIYAYLKDMILSKTIHLGELLPAETEFCSQLDISRTTIRQAFAALEKDNLIVRIKGKGTFVSEPMLNRTLNNLYSFSDEMTSMGLSTSAEVRSFEIIKAAPEMIAQFGLTEPYPDIFRVVRLRTVDNSPLTLETVYIPCNICPVLSKELLNTTSLYKILHQFSGILPSSASEVYSSVNLPRDIAKLLNCSAGTSAFLVDRVSRDIYGKVFELAHIYVRGDRCRYEVELKSNNVSFLRKIDEQSN